MVRRALLVLPVLLLLAAGAAGAGPDRVEIPLDRARLVWTAGGGLAVSYEGVPVFEAHSGEITVHPRDWSRALFRSNDTPVEATFERRGEQQVLTVRWAGGGFKAVERVIAGPGDRYRLEWRYSQDAWDDASIQLGLSRPTERFFAGATFRGQAAGAPIAGAIPVKAPANTNNPFAGASEVALSSFFGTVRLKAGKPTTLYDYAQRNGTFFLGIDEPMPRGKELEFTVDVELAPALLERDGVVATRLRLPSAVEDGDLRAGLELARKPDGPARVRVALVGTDAAGRPFEVAREVALGPQAKEVALVHPLAQAGTARCALVVAALPGGKEILRTPEAALPVLPLLAVVPSLSLYTDEARGALLVRTAPGLKGRPLSFTAEGAGLKVAGIPQPGERVTLPFETAGLPNGLSEVVCRLQEGGRELASVKVALTKAPPKPNTVKIDYATRGLSVDGLPYLPFGFYCVFPAGDLPTVEATQGFTHLAAYQGADTDAAQVKAYFDRCDAVGMKVHYDIRALAQSEPSPRKWEKLRAQVEAVRDHPALLCWYLCDEPDGQGIPPARLDEAYRFVRNLDPYHPITMVFCVPPKAHEYVNGMDIMMADPYPIPHAPVTEVSRVTDNLNRAVDCGMPLWIVPQAFGGGEGWKREPSAQEERVMTYLALIHGATGIQYFVRRAPIGNPIAPSLWSECRRLALEGQELAPELLSPEPRPVVESSVPAVHAAAWRREGVLTIVAANTENRPASVRLSLGEKVAGRAAVLFANRVVEVKDGVIEDMLDGFGTRAYRVMPAALAGAERAPAGPVAAGIAPRAPAVLDPANLTVNPSFEESANTGTPDGCYVVVGRDAGASLFVDPRLAVHGGHSLRLCTPAEGEGVTVQPFPVAVKAGRRYRLSMWARGLQDGLKFRFGMSALEGGEQSFTATRGWAEYALEGTAGKDGRSSAFLSLVGKGTLWVDLMQMVEVKAP